MRNLLRRLYHLKWSTCPLIIRKNGYCISISFLFVCFCTILQSATAIVFNLENKDYDSNKSEQSQKKTF